MTQETTHTPEPWNWHEPWSVFKGYKIIDGNDDYILQVNHDYEDSDWDAAAAARIVACVNACEGMADPAAEIAALRDALEKFTILNPNHYRDIAGLIQNAKDVLSKAKGGRQ